MPDAAKTEAKISEAAKTYGIWAVIQATLKEHHVSLLEIASDSKRRRVSAARRLLYRYFVQQTPLSYEEIGEVFDRHHSAVWKGAWGKWKSKPVPGQPARKVDF